MAPTKRQRSLKEVGSSSQVPSWPQWTSRISTNARTHGNVPYPPGLTNPDHVARYNYSNECMIIATHNVMRNC